MAVRFLLNGKPVVSDSVDPHQSLLHFLREAGWTGTKEACAEGECGACAVALVRRDLHGNACFMPVNSCLVPVPAVDGESIVSVEGVAAPDGELHPVQRAMVAAGGSQCGYCTPGFVISLFCEFYRPGRTGYDSEAISGNLCRCTGYRPIAELARALPQPAAGDPRVAWLAAQQPAEPRGFQHQSPAASFARPRDVSELFDMQQRWPGARLIAGGTDVMVEVNQQRARWPTLIALDGLRELKRFECNQDEIVLGAGIALWELAQRLEQAGVADAALLAQLWPLFSSRLIRNRATLGGNLATASPIGDALPVLLALEAQLCLLGPRGERRIALPDFFVGYRHTALEPGELIASIHLPRPLPALQRFYKVSKRRLDDISGVAAAFALDLESDGGSGAGERRVARLRVAYGGIAATPLRAGEVEQLASGRPWNRDTLAAMVAQSERLGTPLSDHRASAAYRRAMIGKLLEKFFEDTMAIGDHG
jgi:xanthine dehydrogenase small subunit